jgi:hypothetical protein
MSPCCLGSSMARRTKDRIPRMTVFRNLTCRTSADTIMSATYHFMTLAWTETLFICRPARGSHERGLSPWSGRSNGATWRWKPWRAWMRMRRSSYRREPTDTPNANDDGFKLAARAYDLLGLNPAMSGNMSIQGLHYDDSVPVRLLEISA